MFRLNAFGGLWVKEQGHVVQFFFCFRSKVSSLFVIARVDTSSRPMLGGWCWFGASLCGGSGSIERVTPLFRCGLNRPSHPTVGVVAA